MSYILDALRRSQAERERGQVPGLHAQPAVIAGRKAAGDHVPRRGLLWAGLVVAAALALAAWAWLPRVASVAPQAAVTAALPAPPGVQPAPSAPAPAPAALALPVVVSATPSPGPLLPGPAVAPAAPPSQSVGPASASPPGGTPKAPAAAPVPRSVKLAELGAELRRELPPLVMGGSIWSESATARFVIINGQVVREGEGAGPGVVVERIAPRAVLLRWRELLIEAPL